MRSSESKLKMDLHVEGRAKEAGIRWRVLHRLLKSRGEDGRGDRRSAFSPGRFIFPVVCKA